MTGTASWAAASMGKACSRIAVTACGWRSAASIPIDALAIEDVWRLLFEEDILRNRARNRKEQEKEAARNVAFYADGGPLDVMFAIDRTQGHSTDCDVFDRPPDGIVKPCNCGPKDVFVGLPQEYKSPAAERLKANLLKTQPLCHQDPCNDPACRLDHEGREIQVFDGDLSRYWER